MRIVKSRLVKALFAQAWLVGLAAGAGHCWANAAVSIGLTGWNADVIYQSNYPGDVVQGFDGEGNGSYSWVENGTYGAADVLNGLPFDGTVTSTITDQYTKTNTVFQLQAYNGNNELKLGVPTVDPGQTLTLTAPAGYNNLAILAASGNRKYPNNPSTLTLTFSDGSTSSIPYDPYDWGSGSSSGQNAFAANLVRGPSGTEGESLAISSASYNMYETDINLTMLTSSDGALDSAKYIKSITFAEPKSGRIGVFAVSGVQNSSAADLLPEPSTVALLAAAALPLLLRQSARRRLARWSGEMAKR